MTGCGLSRRTALLLVLVPAFGPGAAAAAAETAAGGVQFTDVAADVGVTLLNVSGEEEQEYLVDTMMGGAAFLDHDSDGDLDLYLLNGGRIGGFPEGGDPGNALYRNDGAAFADDTEAAGLGDTGWGMGVAVADYDNDGDPDVFITNYGRNVLYRNEGGGFADVTARAGVGDDGFGTGCAFFDSDRDGDLDLYVANYVDFRHFMETTPQRRHTWRGLTVHFGPRGLRGEPDVFYRNDGDGVFTDATAAANLVDEERLYGLGVVAGDLDDDGHADLYVANDTGPNYLYRNQGDGTFEELGWMAGVAYGESGEAQGSMGIALGDYDNDEDADILVTNFWEETNTLYRNDGGGEVFSDVTFAARVGLESFPFLAWGTEFFDYDNDGDKDLFVANGHIFPQVDRANLGVAYAQRNQLFEGLGDGTFHEVSLAAGPGLQIEKVSRGAAFGDYDDDGDVDILVLNLNDAPTLLRNDGGNRANWLLVRTVGTASNRDGVGAKVRVRCGERTQVREVASGSSYLSSSDPRLHFGLGQAARVDEVRVTWPNGLVEAWRGREANQLLVVREGSGAQPD